MRIDIHIPLVQILHSVLCILVPDEINRKTVVLLEESASLEQLLNRLDIEGELATSLDDIIMMVRAYPLNDSIVVQMFYPSGRD